MTFMKAAVIREAGGPDVLKVEDWPLPEPTSDQVLIRVKVFGLNRSELFTRRGLSPDVQFPRVLGIEAVGEVASAPDGQFEAGAVVATAMGGMGRQFDGGYAQYVCVPVSQVQQIETSLPWETLGALPEMLQTAWGALFRALRLTAGETLLVRGGTTSVGLAAAAIAKAHGATVISTSRSLAREGLLRSAGADKVVIDSGTIADTVKGLGGADKVLELIGTTTLADSLQCAREPGLVCMMGMVGDKWWIDRFSPMEVIPTAVGLTTYDGGPTDFMRTPLQELARQVEAGTMPVHVGKVFHLAEIAEAHRCMEENRAGGKIVVLTD
jgi:NADPH:quinone reductase-like Zn-dependent oxidoreductase